MIDEDWSWILADGEDIEDALEHLAQITEEVTE